jgi:hypothetical protein
LNAVGPSARKWWTVQKIGTCPADPDLIEPRRSSPNDRVADSAVGDEENAGHDDRVVSGEPMTISLMLLLSGLLVGVILWRVRRRYGRPGVMIATGVLILVALGAWVLPPLAIQSDRSVGWELGHGFGGPKFDPATAQTTTTIPIVVDWPGCESGDWLATPAIVYTPWSVTITMSISDAFAAKGEPLGWCLSGKYVRVQLSEPLGGRQLFDGSWFPAHARSANDPDWSVAQ